MNGHPVLMMFAATLTGLVAQPATAQTEVTIELGASRVGPPSGLDGDHAHFGMGGLRLTHYTLNGSGVSASLMLGQAFGDPSGGDFTSAVVAGTLLDDWGTSWTGGIDVELVGFQVASPFPYRAFILEGGPSLTFQGGPVALTAQAVGGVGRSRVEVWRVVSGPHRVFEDGLWRLGGTGEVQFGTGTLQAGLMGGVHQGAGGSYTSGGASMTLSGRWGAAEVRAGIWDTPLGRETTGGLTFVIPMSGWSLRGFLGKSEPDPLTLAEPGSGGGGVLLGRRIFSSADERARDTGLYRVVDGGVDRARVRIAIGGPAGARAVALMGDFTLWDPVPMRRDGQEWVAEVDVAYGTHHYGFLVNDEWYLPSDVRDVVADEWGRDTAILVIEGAN